MIYLRQSTAGQEVLLGPFLDSTDGVSAMTGLTVANTDIKLWFNGATSEANKNSGGATHIAAGRYYTVLDATDTATIGPLEINVAVSGALPVRRECCVLHANVYDVLFGSVAPSTHTAAAVQALVAAGAVASVTGNVGGNVTGSVGSVVGAVGSVTGSVGSVTGNVGGNVVGSVANVTGGINTAAGTITTLDGLDTAQDSQHGTTQAAIAGLNDLDSTAVQSAAAAALTAYDPPTKAEVDTAVAGLLTTQMAESYNADGTAPTLAQSLFVVMQRLTESSISGTSVTVKRLDGSTTAYTLTLNDATTPTSSTRAS